MRTLILSLATLVILLTGNNLQAQDAKEIVRKAYNKMQGESNRSEMQMKIIRPKWTREYAMISWAKGRDYSLVLITAPAKDKGQTFLKRNNEMWNWRNNIKRMIKISPSMMSQGWMGSDYSNDDILKESSIVEDYTHTIISTENIQGKSCWKIKLTPKPNAPVAWGKQMKWISKGDYLQLKTLYYDEDNYLIKTEKCSDIRQMDDRTIPTKIEIIPEDKPGHKTVLTIKKAKFSVSIPANFFSQQNMKKEMALKNY